MIKIYDDLVDSAECFGVRLPIARVLTRDAYEASQCLEPDEIPVDRWITSKEKQLTKLLGGRPPTRKEKAFWEYMVEVFLHTSES